MKFHTFMRYLALFLMSLSCGGVVMSIRIGHSTLTVLFAVVALVFLNLSRWHDRRTP